MHFLQTDAWKNFQESLGRQTFQDKGDGWSYLAILETGTGNSRLYCPYGPTFSDEAGLDKAINSLVTLAHKLNVTFVRIEPTDSHAIPYLTNHKWQKVDYQHLNPERTMVVDLTPSVDDIIAKMTPTNRNLYRNYTKKGLSIHHSTDPKDMSPFLELIDKVAQRTGMRPHSDNYFLAQANSLFPTNSASLFYVKYNENAIAASLIYDNQTTRYYAHAGNDSDYRKLSAGNILVAEMIVDAKNKGLSSFDLYGVAPVDAPVSHPWAGFSAFKRGFGGQEVVYTGSWDLPIKPLPYQIYRQYQKIYHSVRSHKQT